MEVSAKAYFNEGCLYYINDFEFDDGGGKEKRNKYVLYFNKLEKLWSDFDAERFDEKEATEQFYILRKDGADIEALDNELDIRTIKKLCGKADIESRNYISQYHS